MRSLQTSLWWLLRSKMNFEVTDHVILWHRSRWLGWLPGSKNSRRIAEYVSTATLPRKLFVHRTLAGHLLYIFDLFILFL